MNAITEMQQVKDAMAQEFFGLSKERHLAAAYRALAGVRDEYQRLNGLARSELPAELERELSKVSLGKDWLFEANDLSHEYRVLGLNGRRLLPEPLRESLARLHSYLEIGGGF